MKVKKFEADTLQEAIDQIKREMGPEAVILQTKKNKKTLFSKGGVEVTVAISDRAATKKKVFEKKTPENVKTILQGYSAEKQADFYEKTLDMELEKAVGRQKDQVKLTATRYADIGEQPRIAMSAGAGSSAATGGRSSATYSNITRAAVVATPPPPPPVVMSAPTSVGTATGVGATASLEANLEMKKIYKEIEDLKNVVLSLKEITTQKINGDYSGRSSSHPILQEVFEEFVFTGFDRSLMYGLMKKVEFQLGSSLRNEPSPKVLREKVLDQIAEEIYNNISVLDDGSFFFEKNEEGERSHPIVTALVGPTGSGKTLMAAKLAHHVKKDLGKSVGLIHLQSKKSNSIGHLLEDYSRLLNVPFRLVENEHHLKLALEEFSPLEEVLLDCSGFSTKESEKIQKLHKLFEKIPNLRTHLVLSLTTRDYDLVETVKRFAPVLPLSLIFTKIDEACAFGSMYSLSQKFKLPLSFFSTGQKFPSDFEVAAKERVVALLMDLM